MRRWATPLLISLACAVVATAALASCSSSGSNAQDTTTTTTAAPGPTTASTTAAPAAPPVAQTTNQAAAQHLIDAWQAHDRTAALQSATASAVDTMLAIPTGNLNVRGCDDGTFETSSCVYRLLSNQYEIRIDLARHAGGWIAADVQYSAPTP